MLELLVQNVTKYQQLCQGTWGHKRKPDKRLSYEQDPSSLLIVVSCTLRRAGRIGRIAAMLFKKKKKKTCMREILRKKGKTDIPKATKWDRSNANISPDHSFQL